MKRLLHWWCVLNVAQIWGMTTSPTIATLLKAFPTYVPLQQRLVVVDLDNTLVEGASTLRRQDPRGERAFLQDITDSYCKLYGITLDTGKLESLIAREAEYRPVEGEKTKNVFVLLKELEVPVVALTARSWGTVELLGGVVDWTKKQIKDIGIDFGTTFNKVPSRELRGTVRRSWLGTNFEDPVRCFCDQSFIFAGKDSKGSALLMWLNYIAALLNWQPSGILFIDDRVENVLDVMDALSTRGIFCAGIYYTHPDAQTVPPLDRPRSLAQVLYLLHHKKWLSEKTMDQLIFDKKTLEFFPCQAKKPRVPMSAKKAIWKHQGYLPLVSSTAQKGLKRYGI